MKSAMKSAQYFWLAIICAALMYFAVNDYFAWQQSKEVDFQFRHLGVLIALFITAIAIVVLINIKPSHLTKLYSTNTKYTQANFVSLGMQPPEATFTESEIDPADLPDELHTANIAFRAVINGHGNQKATLKNRLVDYLETNFKDLKPEAIKRIATVANPDKSTGRKKIE